MAVSCRTVVPTISLPLCLRPQTGDWDRLHDSDISCPCHGCDVDDLDD